MKKFVPICAIVPFVCLASAQPSQAQIVNIQSALSGDLPDGAGLAAELRQEKKSGNTDTERLAGQGTLTYKTPEDLWLLVFRREYSKESSESSTDSYFHHLRYRYSITENWGWEGYGQEDADRFRRSARRNILGSGPRYQNVFFDSLNYAVSLAYMHEREEFSKQTDELNVPSRETNRLAHVLYLSWKWPDCCSLGNVFYYQPKIGHLQNHKTLSESSLLFQINKHLSYRISYNYVYNGLPPKGVNKVDTNFLQALVVKI